MWLKSKDSVDEESEYLTKADKRRKRSKKLFKSGSFVPLGLLVKESDPNYKSKAPTTHVRLTAQQTLRAKDKYVDPSSWAEFSLLFVRLIRGYITVGDHISRADALFDYLERLSIHHQVRTCSDEALIAYDKRVRSRSEVPFDWLGFDQELFEVVKAEFGQLPHRASGVRRTPVGGSWAITRSDRTRHGICHSWAAGKPCEFQQRPEGCRFAHWCVNPECVRGGKSDHKPDQCPRSGQKVTRGSGREN